MALVLAARRSLALRPSRISCVSRLAAVSASFSVSASVMPEPSESDALIFLLFGEGADLRGGAVADDDANVQRAQHGDIEQDVGKVFLRDDGAIEAEHENLFAEARDVLQDAAEISWFHFWIFTRTFSLSQISRRTRRGFNSYFAFGLPRLEVRDAPSPVRLPSPLNGERD